MALIDLQSLKTLVQSGCNEVDEREVFKELLYAILCKAARVDLHADTTEVDMIAKIMLEYTGEEYDSAAIRTEISAKSRDDSLRPVAQLASKLSEEMRVLAIVALEQVMRADETVSYAEIDYFNAVAAAMRLSFADVAGLVKG